MNTISAVKVNFMLPLWKLPGLVPLPFFFFSLFCFPLKRCKLLLKEMMQSSGKALGKRPRQCLRIGIILNPIETFGQN